jgi:rhodanese-related sulfurtransferase
MDISATELQDFCRNYKSVNSIDVREEIEFHTFNIGGQNIPLSRLKRIVNDLKYDKTDEIIVICQRGLRSKTAKELLVALGYKKVRNLTEVLLAWKRVNTDQHLSFKSK